MTGARRESWLPALLVAGLSLAVTVSGVGNSFAYDDVDVIANDGALHSPATALPRAFDPYLGNQMLRPVPLLGFAAQWAIGGGSPLVFRVVSLVLYAMVSVVVLLLLRRAGAPAGPALVGALVFAVHPVHSEVTANTVSQAELLSTLSVMGAVVLYLRARAFETWRRRDSILLAALCLAGTHTKESAYVLPGLLVAAEMVLVRDPASWRDRLRLLREPALILLAVVLGSLLIRKQVLGELGGGLPHSSLEGLGIADRIVSFLGLVPEWFRLLLWPVRLQAEYGPPALDPTAPFGVPHAGGIILLVAAAALLAWSWHRAPLVAFGVAWAVIGMSPVANLLFPTGIIVAERTLFLPSVGLAFVVSGAAVLVLPSLAARPRARLPVLALGGLVILAAGLRSAVRQPDWRNTYTVLQSTVETSPTTYRAHLTFGREQRRLGAVADAEASFRRAAELWARDSRPFEEWGQSLRVRGACHEAIAVLQRGVEADSTSDAARGRLIECLIVERRWDDAEREIHRGLAQGVTGYRNAMGRVEAGRLAATLR